MAGSIARFVFAALAAASLAACAVPGDGPATARTPDAAPTGPLAARPKLDPILRFDTDPRQLIGLDGSQVSVLLGRPTLKRRDPPAEIWQYAGRDCVLMLFLYDQPKVGRNQVDHVEVRSKAGVPSTDRCVAGFLRANAGTVGEG